jgi:DNA adenine methylase
MTALTPTRPALRWHGGKWKLAPWIIGHFPAHRVYVEPFGGAGSVLLRKPRAYAEIYNDLDDELVALFRVLRDPERAAELVRRLELTPFARAEFEAAYAPAEDEIEVARRLVVRSFQGFGCNATRRDRTTGFRSNSNRSGTTPAHDWRSLPGALPAVVERLRGVVVERLDAFDLMARHDGPDTLHYVDPPYLMTTRSTKRYGKGAYHTYKHEIGDEGHAGLLDALRGLSGFVVLSGYPSPLYDAALPGWGRTERAALADGARERTEVLWLNPACVAALEAQRAQPQLFGAA